MIRILLAAFAALCLLSSSLRAQGGPPPPEVTVAQAALRAGDADSAIRTLEGFFQRNPNAFAGKLLLGNAYRQKGSLDKALATYLAISLPRPLRLQAMYSAAGIHAVQGHSAEALALLQKLKASGASAAAIQAKIQETEKFKVMYDNPLLNAAMTFIEPFPVGLGITLISAAVLRKKAPSQQAESAVAAS